MRIRIRLVFACDINDSLELMFVSAFKIFRERPYVQRRRLNARHDRKFVSTYGSFYTKSMVRCHEKGEKSKAILHCE